MNIKRLIMMQTLGCVPPVPGYFKAMREVCDRHGALLILDEVMSGMGRTGTLHAWQHERVVPDLQTVAKGLGAGYVPIGALLLHKKVVDVLSKGSKAFVHSQTYQGHPVACAAALAVQSIVTRENLLENVKVQGELLGKLLRERLGRHKHVGDVRGRGLLWGVSLFILSPFLLVVFCVLTMSWSRWNLSRTKQQKSRSQHISKSGQRSI